MAQFYIKNDDGEFVDGDEQVEALWREKSGRIVSGRMAEIREKDTAKIREEIEPQVRAEIADSIRKEVKTELEDSYKVKLDEAESKARLLDTQLRRKTIAAEYGFKPETEQFLGEGSDEDMRAKADALKSSFQPVKAPSLEKETSDKSISNGFVKLSKD